MVCAHEYATAFVGCPQCQLPAAGVLIAYRTDLTKLRAQLAVAREALESVVEREDPSKGAGLIAADALARLDLQACTCPTLPNGAIRSATDPACPVHGTAREEPKR